MHKISSKFRAAWVQAQTEHMFKSNMISTWDQGFKHQILHMRAHTPTLNPTNRCRRKLLTMKNKPYQNNTTLELKPSSNFSATLYNECNFVQHSRGMSSVHEHWELNVSLQARNLILTNNSVHELITVSHNSVTFGSNVILLESKMQSKEMPSEANLVCWHCDPKPQSLVHIRLCVPFLRSMIFKTDQGLCHVSLPKIY